MTQPLPFRIDDPEIQDNFDALAMAVPHIPRQLWGMITPLGAINVAGSGGWTVARTAVGAYTVTITTAFAAANYTPTISIVAGLAVGQIPTVLAGSFTINTYSLAGAAADVATSFHVFGART